jgi:hypothetical protein
MTRPPSFISVILLVLLATAIPSQSFATTIDSDTIESSDSDSKMKNKKDRKKSKNGEGDDVLEAIFTLGGLLGSNGGSSSGRSGGNSGGGTEGDSMPSPPGRCDDCPPYYPGDGNGGEHGNPSAPVPEPSAALLFGFGILAVASRRNLRS